MKQIKGLLFIVLLFSMSSSAPEEKVVNTEIANKVIANEFLAIVADSSWVVYDSSQYSATFLKGLKEHSSHYNIKVYRDFFLLGNDTIRPPDDLVLDSVYTLMARVSNKILKVELKRRNNTNIYYHIAVWEDMEKTLLSMYGNVELYPTFYLAAEAEEDENGNGYFCTSYTDLDINECVSICIGTNDDNRLMVLVESHCQAYHDLKNFGLPTEVSQKEFYKRVVVLKDSSEYSKEFLLGWKRQHIMDEIITMRKGYLLVGMDDTLAFPEQIAVGKRYVYEATEKDTIQRLVLTRKNTTTLNYDISLLVNAKQLWNETGEVHFEPAHLMTAIDGHCWYYYKSLANDYQKTCNLRICVDGVSNEENAQFEYLNCEGVLRKYYLKLQRIE